MFKIDNGHNLCFFVISLSGLIIGLTRYDHWYNSGKNVWQYPQPDTDWV